MIQKEYWNIVSKKKEFTIPFQLKQFNKYVLKEKLILDVGCGYGRTLDKLYQTGYKNLLGIDFSEGMIQRGKEQFPCLDLRIKANQEIDLQDRSVDAVILFAVLTCIKENHEQQQLLSEIKRVLRPNGIIYVSDFLLNTDKRNMERYRKFEKVYGNYGVFELPEGAICRHHNELWIKQLLGDFVALEYDHLVFTTMNGNKSNGFYFIGKKLC